MWYVTNKQSLLYKFAKFFGLYGISYVFFVGIFFLYKQNYLAIILSLAAFILGRIVVSPAIYFFIKKKRPYQANNFLPPATNFFSPLTNKYNAFPSDHALSLSAIISVWLMFDFNLAIIGVVVLLLVGASRIILGYHDIWDTVFGIIFGSLCGFLMVSIALYQGLLF